MAELSITTIVTPARNTFTGIVHLVMKAIPPQAGQQALVRGSDLLGLQVGRTDEGFTLGLGRNRRRKVDILSSDTAVYLVWPSSDFLDLRIGNDAAAILPPSPTTTPNSTGETP